MRLVLLNSRPALLVKLQVLKGRRDGHLRPPKIAGIEDLRRQGLNS